MALLVGGGGGLVLALAGSGCLTATKVELQQYFGPSTRVSNAVLLQRCCVGAGSWWVMVRVERCWCRRWWRGVQVVVVVLALVVLVLAVLVGGRGGGG